MIDVLHAIPPLTTFEPRTELMADHQPQSTREKGVRCPRCNSTDIPVKFTRHYGQRSKQTRECKHCKKRFGVWLSIIPDVD